MEFQENVSLAKYTTFKIGGPAKYFFIAKNKIDLLKAVQEAKKRRLPFFILGGGSNLLVSDKGFKGLVVKAQNTDYKISKNILTAGAGASLARLVSAAANAGLAGMEWASGIPSATLGGAVRGNAGAFGLYMKDLIVMVEAFDAGKLKIKEFSNRACQFSDKSSIFKKNHNLIILSCKLKLKKNNRSEILKKTRGILNHRKSRHPFYPSAGSIFKNLKSVQAWDLIEKAGLKGKKIGRAQISPLHANFIVNLGGATAKNVLDLIDLIKKTVVRKLKKKLEEEIVFLK